MDETSGDQSRLYREYFDRIVAMNQQNADYLSSVGAVSAQRQAALQRAIELHITPVVGRLQKIRLVFGIVAGIALISMLYSCNSSLANLSQETSLSGLWAAASGLVTLVALGILVLCGIVLIYVGRKLADLNSRAKAALEARINPSPQ